MMRDMAQTGAQSVDVTASRQTVLTEARQLAVQHARAWAAVIVAVEILDGSEHRSFPG